MLYSGKSTRKGLVSLIIYLANKGYLGISQSQSGNSKFYIQKMKSYDGTNSKENEFIKMLVPSKSITSKELETSTVFYKRCESYMKSLDKIRDDIFYSSSLKANVPMSLLLYGLIFTELYTSYNFNFEDVFRFLLCLIVLLPATFFIFKNRFSFIFSVVCLIPFIKGMPKTNNLALIIFGAICIIIAGICYYQIPKRNEL